MSYTTVYIEGTPDTDNGNLRKAFSALFEKELKGKMPKITMGDGMSQTIRKFQTVPLNSDEKRFLLVDSDEFIDENYDQYKTNLLNTFNNNYPNRKIDCKDDNTFFMIQEVEAWILSQPEILKEAGINTKKLLGKNVKSISKPSQFLAELYKNSQKQYHKVREFSKVFINLDPTKLKDDFNDFKRLISELKKI